MLGMYLASIVQDSFVKNVSLHKVSMYLMLWKASLQTHCPNFTLGIREGFKKNYYFGWIFCDVVGGNPLHENN